jgi:Fe-S cluster assembly protein SufD
MSEAALPALLASFEAQAAALSGRDAARREAAARARRLGLPPPRAEAWRFTPLRALAARAFAGPAGTAPPLDPLALAAIPAPRLVWVNGVLDEGLSNLTALPAGVSIDTAPAAEEEPVADDPFEAWNTALAQAGARLTVEADARIDPPLQLVFASTADGGERAFHLRHRLVLGERARLTLATHFVGVGAHRHLSNHVFELLLADEAQLEHAQVQRESEGASLLLNTRARLAARARYRRVDLELGAALCRHALGVALDGEGATLEANGVLRGDGRRHVETRLGIEHRARDTACQLLWRGLGADRSRVVFHGGIQIAAGADGTRAALSNKNLLLSDAAEIDTQPVLVIHADDVQAAHGATVGRLDDQALFYLRARGLPQAEASALLTAAFLREPLAALGHEGLRAALDLALQQALGSEAPA